MILCCVHYYLLNCVCWLDSLQGVFGRIGRDPSLSSIPDHSQGMDLACFGPVIEVGDASRRCFLGVFWNALLLWPVYLWMLLHQGTARPCGLQDWCSILSGVCCVWFHVALCYHSNQSVSQPLLINVDRARFLRDASPGLSYYDNFNREILLLLLFTRTVRSSA